MVRLSLLAGLVAATAALISAATLPTISTVGSHFYDSTGKQFFVKGVAYQLVPEDPLLDTQQCTNDASLMKTLGANTIRVYHVSPFGDHSGCMAAFANAGIYLIIDLDTFNTTIDPRTPTWTSVQFQAFASVMDVFSGFTNVLGFFIGNEVIAQADQSNAAPYIKAAVRDLKAYRDQRGYRKIPVGYSAADIAELRPMLQNYLVCGGNKSESIDFFGLNAYEWCGHNSYQGSGYKILNDMSAGYPVPIFFSETGCNTLKPRTFEDQAVVLGPDMNQQWSGSIVYEWIEETNDYGLISYAPPAAAATGSNVQDGFLRKGTPTPVEPDFDNLKSAWATVSPIGTPSAQYTPNLTTPPCPSSTPGGWLVNGNVPLPSVNQAYSGFIPPSVGAGTAAASSVTPSTTPSGSSSSSAASAAATTSTKGAASGGKEVAGMSAALVAVMLGFTYWL